MNSYGWRSNFSTVMPFFAPTHDLHSLMFNDSRCNPQVRRDRAPLQNDSLYRSTHPTSPGRRP